MAKIKNLMKPVEPSEYKQHCAVIKFCEMMSWQYPELRLINASMNGAWIPNTDPEIKGRGVLKNFKWRIIAILKAAGCMKSGFPDLHLPVARGKWHALFIELKKSSRHKPSDLQIWWLRELTALDNYACVCYGENHAKKTIIEYVRGAL